MMDKQVLELYEPIRKHIVESHQFYVDQAQKKLLSQFEHMEEEAEKYAEEWAEKQSEWFDPDRDDPDEVYERAYDENINYYLDLSELKDQTRLSIVAGIYHKWDKEVREWLIRDLRFYPQTIKDQLWSKDIGKIIELLEGMGWKIKQSGFYEKLDACRLIVNVYKHGNGNSLDSLKKKYPRYLEDPLKQNSCGYATELKYLGYQNLKITDIDFLEFAQAITDFWQQAPEIVKQSEVLKIPKWKK